MQLSKGEKVYYCHKDACLMMAPRRGYVEKELMPSVELEYDLKRCFSSYVESIACHQMKCVCLAQIIKEQDPEFFEGSDYDLIICYLSTIGAVKAIAGDPILDGSKKSIETSERFRGALWLYATRAYSEETAKKIMRIHEEIEEAYVTLTPGPEAIRAKLLNLFETALTVGLIEKLSGDKNRLTVDEASSEGLRQLTGETGDTSAFDLFSRQLHKFMQKCEGAINMSVITQTMGVAMEQVRGENYVFPWWEEIING